MKKIGSDLANRVFVQNASVRGTFDDVDHTNNNSRFSWPLKALACTINCSSVCRYPAQPGMSRSALANSVRRNETEATLWSQQSEGPAEELRDQISKAMRFGM